MFKKNCRIRNSLKMPSERPKIVYQMIKRRGGGGGKGVLNNVKKTARLVKRGIPYYHQTIKMMDRFQNIVF